MLSYKVVSDVEKHWGFYTYHMFSLLALKLLGDELSDWFHVFVWLDGMLNHVTVFAVGSIYYQVKVGKISKEIWTFVGQLESIAFIVMAYYIADAT